MQTSTSSGPRTYRCSAFVSADDVDWLPLIVHLTTATAERCYALTESRGRSHVDVHFVHRTSSTARHRLRDRSQRTEEMMHARTRIYGRHAVQLGRLRVDRAARADRRPHHGQHRRRRRCRHRGDVLRRRRRRLRRAGKHHHQAATGCTVHIRLAVGARRTEELQAGMQGRSVTAGGRLPIISGVFSVRCSSGSSTVRQLAVVRGRPLCRMQRWRQKARRPVASDKWRARRRGSTIREAAPK